MIKRIFVSYSFKNRSEYKDFHGELTKYFSSKGIETYSFVFDFRENIDDRGLMKVVFAEIDKADLILVELTNKSVGVGVESGYAKAKGKVVGYLYKNGSDLQQTVNGIVDYLIPYTTAGDVISWFEDNRIWTEL